jgi:EAL domain-containing protein (putative c-di-GMP-specific phosphodiesterase class I)/DNA-binding CsgD family transcriptional regulator
MALSGEAADKISGVGLTAPIRQQPLCYVLDNEAPLRRIISFSAAGRNFRCVECTSIENLINRIFLESPDLIFIDIEFADADAVEIIRYLEQARYSGAVHLMSRRAPSLIATLEKIGARRGLNMGQSLLKPFRRIAVETIFDAALSGISLPEAGTQTPSLATSAPSCGNSLRDALDAGKVDIVFQPRFDFEIGRPYGAEAYARHTVSGQCLLSRHGSTAHSDDVDRLTEFMLVAAMKAWRRFARPSFNPAIALRVPLASLARLRIGEIIRRERPRSGEWPGLVMELTENEIANEPAKVHEIAAQMKIYGLNVSIGDFGTGHSALRTLESVPPSEISINRAFVTNCSGSEFNAKICSSIIFLARSVGARSVAEGISSEADLATLLKLGCDAGQGDALSPPLHAEEFERFIARGEFVKLPDIRPSNLFHLRQTDSRLSLREIEVLELISQGKSSKEVGYTLGLSPRTVDVYRAKLMAKLQARNVAELVKVAMSARH